MGGVFIYPNEKGGGLPYRPAIGADLSPSRLALLCCGLRLVALRTDRLQVALVVCAALVDWRDVIHFDCECDMPSCLTRLAQDCIRKVEVLEYAELGMEAVWRIEVEDFPAFIVIDDKGNDFFKELNLG